MPVVEPAAAPLEPRRDHGLGGVPAAVEARDHAGVPGQPGPESPDLEVGPGRRHHDVDPPRPDLPGQPGPGPERVAEPSPRNPCLGPRRTGQVGERRAGIVGELDRVAARDQPSGQVDDPLLGPSHETERVDEQNPHEDRRSARARSNRAS